MPSANSNKSPFNLHGYQPVVVDESLLTAEERREVTVQELARDPWAKRDDGWSAYLTRKEIQTYVELFNRPIHWDNSLQTAEAQAYQLRRTGRLRRFARQKYSGGQSVWYGDGPPPWLRTAE